MIACTPAGASLELKAEARVWLARAREFADEVVRPLGRVLDRMDAQSAVDLGSPVRDFLVQAHREGYTRLSDSPQRGGIGLSAAAEYLVLEELAAADAGLAVLLMASPIPFRWSGASSLGRLARDVSLPYFRGERLDWIGCAAVAERARLRAIPDSGGWVLSGRTGWVPGAAIATHAAIACTVAAGGSVRCALAIVPLDRWGVSRGRALDELGLRTQARARLALDGVGLAGDELLVAPRASLGVVGAACALDHVVHAIAAVGIGRAAYEGALRVVRERVYKGTPPADHRHGRRLLFRLFTLLEAARALTRSAHLHTCREAGRGDGAIQQASAAHSFAIDAARKIVDGAMELCARSADARGVVEHLDGSTFQPEKLLRDAQSCKFAPPASESHVALAAVAVYP